VKGVVVWSVDCFDIVVEKAEAGVLVKALIFFAANFDVVEPPVNRVAVGVAAAAAVVVVVVVAAEFVAVRAELQAEVKVEMGVVEKVVVSVGSDFAVVMPAAEVVIYVGSVAAADGLYENCIAAAVVGVGQAAVTAEIGAAAKDVGIGVDVVV
jgi:hypothetical protein